MEHIYVQLLDEGTAVYRPVPAMCVGENLYRLEGQDLYHPDDEHWEFEPGDVVMTENRLLENEPQIIAVKKYQT